MSIYSLQQANEQMRKFIESDEWFDKRNGNSRKIIEEIVAVCGYKEIPENPHKFFRMVTEHLKIRYSRRLAFRFKTMASEAENQT